MRVTKIDQSGRILIPKSIRDMLNLKADSKLELRLLDNEIIIHQIPNGEIHEETGIWVWTGVDQLDKALDELISETRFERGT